MSTRYTRDLLPGDRFQSVTGKVRTVKTNTPPGPGGTAHVLTMEEGTTLISQADTRWEVLPPDPAAVWDQGYTAGRANAATERRHGTLPIPPHEFQRNPYRV